MGFRNPVTTLSASRITPGTLPPGVVLPADQVTTTGGTVAHELDALQAGLSATDATASSAEAAAADAHNAAVAAQQSADDAAQAALDAAGLAGGKGRLIYSPTAPTGADATAANLWVRSSDNAPHRWTGTTWQVVTDKAATDAASAAAAAASAAAAAQHTADDAAAAASTASTQAQTAQTAATDAHNAAVAAQQSADDAAQAALDAAGLAGGKGRLIYSPTAPTGADATAANLWVRSSDNAPHRWTGTTWQVVTDKAATDAASAAAAAASAAATAQHTADDAAAAASTASMQAQTALTAANGRNVVTWSTSTPSGTGKAVGDIWFRFAGATVIGQWRWTGAEWLAATIGDAVLANLTAAKITTGALTAGVVITAGTPGGARVELTSAGVRAYGADGTTVLMDLAGGSAVFSGQVLGAIITGGTLRTATTGPRVEVDHANGRGEVRLYNSFDGPARLRAWRADGVNTFPCLELRGGVGSAGETALVLSQDYAPTSGVERVAVLEADRLRFSGALDMATGSLELGSAHVTALTADSLAGVTWSAYTPTLAGVTLGNGTLVARRVRIGRTVHAAGQLTLGSTSAVTGLIVIGLPFTIGGVQTSGMSCLGAGLANKSGVGTAVVFATVASSTTVYLRRVDGSATGPANPFTWGTGDVITWNVTYEAAN